jgi:hypothetical protein
VGLARPSACPFTARAGAHHRDRVLPAHAPAGATAWAAGWVAALTPLSVDGMIVAASTTLLAESRSGGRGGLLPWALLVAGSVASLAANAAIAEPTTTGRVIAAWPSFALIAAYELLMRQIRRAAEVGTGPQPSRRASDSFAGAAMAAPRGAATDALHEPVVTSRAAGRDVQLDAWRWARDNRADDGSLPTGKAIASHYGRHERWGRLVKRSGLAGELGI